MSSEMSSQQTDAPPKKVTVTLKLDAEVVRWFMKQNDGNDYHAHINSSLRAYMETKQRQQVKIAHIEQIKRQLAEKGLG